MTNLEYIRQLPEEGLAYYLIQCKALQRFDNAIGWVTHEIYTCPNGIMYCDVDDAIKATIEWLQREYK